jgi:hypothetical protein
VVYLCSTVPTEDTLLQTWNSKTFSSIHQYVPGMYLVCTWYVKKTISIRLGIEQWMSCIASCMLYHYATSVHSRVIPTVNTRYIITTLTLHGICWLVLDVRRGSNSASCPGHDVTGQDIDLNFPDAHLGCGTGLQSTDVAMDCRPTEKQAPGGELAGFTALGTHKACQP